MQTIDELLAVAGKVSASSLRAFWSQIGTELCAVSGRIEAALDALEDLQGLPFVDVGWMDHCPALASIRGAGRFGQVHAVIAARAASLWK